MNKRPRLLLFILLILIASLLIGAAFGFNIIDNIPAQAAVMFGPPAEGLTTYQLYSLSFKLIQSQDLLLQPLDPSAGSIPFLVNVNESTGSIINNLEAFGLIASGDLFRDYLIYSGLDTRLQAGEYILSPAMSAIEIAEALLDATPSVVSFTILKGWRLEEIAASLPTTGLEITPDEFLQAANQRYQDLRIMEHVPVGVSLEGILPPGTFELERTVTAEELIRFLLKEREENIPEVVVNGFAQQGLSLYQGMILASIVQKEAVVVDEMPLIASVFHNRLTIPMKLETDPTVQYALGYNASSNSWWKTPLTFADLDVDSPYNTYRYPGLPPTPIASPGLAALQAVAFPAQTPYYYFRAACDKSGKHNFSETFEEHLQFACE
jgi:UPF0755 protein